VFVEQNQFVYCFTEKTCGNTNFVRPTDPTVPIRLCYVKTCWPREIVRLSFFRLRSNRVVQRVKISQTRLIVNGIGTIGCRRVYTTHDGVSIEPSQGPFAIYDITIGHCKIRNSRRPLQRTAVCSYWFAVS